MTKTPRLSKSGVEYLDYSWGVFSGCDNLQTGDCSVKACWAKGIASHYPKLYPNGFDPTYYPEAIDSPKHLRKPSVISVGWVGDIIGYGLDHRTEIFETISMCPQHSFLFLTKNPDHLSLWEPFPDNCWVGMTATDHCSFLSAIPHLASIKATKRFLSIEPFLGSIYLKNISIQCLDWVIIGQQTPIRPETTPKIEWIQEIVEACDKAGIPVFLKNNLKSLLQQNEHNLYSLPEWAGIQFAVTGDHSLAPNNPHPNEPMRKLRQERPRS